MTPVGQIHILTDGTDRFLRLSSGDEGDDSDDSPLTRMLGGRLAVLHLGGGRLAVLFLLAFCT